MRGNLIIDLQFGSTGKGLIAGYLARRDRPDTLVTAWAANAGHTFIDSNGAKYVHTMLANGIVSPGLRQILIGPGSVIDPHNLRQEIDAALPKIPGLAEVEIVIHPHAAIIEQRHRDEEAGPMTKIGSTKKGCGAAAIQRIRRDPDDTNVAYRADTKTVHPLLLEYGLERFVAHSPYAYLCNLASAQRIQIEGAQGYSLSMYNGFYPYTTSRDVSTAQVMADCGLPMNWIKDLQVVGTARTYPIRVANRFDEHGAQVGWSGPNYTDQKEISFEAIGQPVELTTVTKLPRRIFTFSMQQLWEAVTVCGVDELFLNFANYMSEVEFTELRRRINYRFPGLLRYIGNGPTYNDIAEVV